MAENVLFASLTPLGLPSEWPGGAPAVTGSVPGFVMQHQLQTQWCWAAVSASVAAFHSQSISQCAVVNLTRGLNSCCQSGGSVSCNQPWYLDQALTKTGTLAQFLEQYLSWSQLTPEIDGARPVGVRTQWSNGGGHFLAVSGYNAQTGLIDVRDPWYGDSSVSYTGFVSSYLGSGRWTHSYLTTLVNSPTTGTPSQGTTPAPAPNDPWQPVTGNSSGSTTTTPSTPTTSPTTPAPYDPWQPRF